MDNISKYDLHKNDFSKLHFEINDAKPYLLKNLDHASIPHRHSFYQVIWFKTPGRHYVDYEIIDHPENTIFFINTNQIHYFCPDSVNEGILFHFNDYFISQFNPEFLERFSLSVFNEIGKPYLELSETETERFSVFSKVIEEEIQANDIFMREEVYSVFTSLLFLIERLKSKETKIDFNLNSDFKLAYLFKKEVYKNKQSFSNIDFYSDLLHTNNKKLTSVVKQYLGNTPANIIISIKILEAKRRLANGKFSIQEIAYDLGFDQPTYFTKYFKKATGITPKEFQSSILP
ncbi:MULTISPECIES: helix-turn-helix domain-containing protein [Flavobacterium]|uniref:helix-turn-helix domain-containing protein n=1 Tax=Flavobacterium TaxID=237 RepID=UPI002115C1D9|nr:MULTISPECIES: AraC family transcriptional regulator [Flavobacterium]UUF12294.1 AraC family transcriptional regulator [Flavobacterium panici]